MAKKSAAKDIRILVSNDDGINAEGLQILEKIAREISSDVWTVAPETEQSGTGHSLTLHFPLRTRHLSEKRYAVSGTPTDSVLLGVRSIIPRKKKISLILSGVNRGSNLAEDVTYSGTCAAAMEGTLIGIPSIAFSQAFTDRKPVPWGTAEKYAAGLIRKLMKASWPKNTFINVNFPDVAPSKVKGVRVCPQGLRAIGEKLIERIDPKGRPYYWIGNERHDTMGEPGVDYMLVKAGYITITPQQMDMTDYKTMETLRAHVER